MFKIAAYPKFLPIFLDMCVLSNKINDKNP